jgi:hypothetical protein
VYCLKDGGKKESFLWLSKMTTCEDDHVGFRVNDSEVRLRFSKITKDVSRFLTCCKDKIAFDRISVEEKTIHVKEKKKKIDIKPSPSRGKKSVPGINSRHSMYVPALSTLQTQTHTHTHNTQTPSKLG